MSKNITVRELQYSEIDRFVPLRHALWPDSESSHKSELRDLLAQPHRYRIFIAETDSDDWLGWLEAGLREQPESLRPAKMGYIEGWYVDEAHRRRGVGKMLLAAAEDWARACGCKVMASDTWPENEVSIAAHLQCGFEIYERAVLFRKTLR